MDAAIIIEYRCHRGHVLTACAFSLDGTTREAALIQFQEVSAVVVQPWCNLCGSNHVSYYFAGEYDTLELAFKEVARRDAAARIAAEAQQRR